MKIAFYTLGCKVNQFETEKIITSFKEKGFDIGDFTEVCDVYLINTCSVTALADKKSRQISRRAKRLNDNALIVMCGCSVEGKKPEEFFYADVVVGNKDKLLVCDIVCEKLNFIAKINHKAEITSTKTRALIKIEDGCNNYCSYCIIPYLRGNIVSEQFSDIIEYAKNLAKSGFLEIVLTGIHITSYNDNGKTLIDLLEELEKIEGIYRIRLGSLEPGYINREIAARISKLKKLCGHFHISLQSGSDTVLLRMNRKYTASAYLSEIELLREYIKNVSITTDIIVGFPNESEKEIAETLEFAKKIKFAKIHIFPYSKREGTKAYDMDGQITKQLKSERAKKLEEIDKQYQTEFLQQNIGEIAEVLIEQSAKNGYYEGYSKNYIKVYIKSEENIKNTIIKVKLIGVMLDGLYGNVV
ncbi:MAG: tRNA (N(6)-L-threonylcarbamoyladenosine(37)-C(2))-methylthiotransferase MtaB [Clostridia bacterium]